MKFFLYNELKRGGKLHSRIHGAEFIRNAITIDRLPLIVTRHNAFLVNEPGVGLRVKGEIWELEWIPDHIRNYDFRHKSGGNYIPHELIRVNSEGITEVYTSILEPEDVPRRKRVYLREYKCRN